MAQNERIRRAIIDGCHDAANEALSECRDMLDTAMWTLEHNATEAELASDSRYGALCVVAEAIRKALECGETEQKKTTDKQQ